MEVRKCYGRKRKDLELRLGVRKMDRVPNSWIGEFLGVMNGVDEEKIDEGVLQWFSHVERIEKIEC